LGWLINLTAHQRKLVVLPPDFAMFARGQGWHQPKQRHPQHCTGKLAQGLLPPLMIMEATHVEQNSAQPDDTCTNQANSIAKNFENHLSDVKQKTCLLSSVDGAP